MYPGWKVYGLILLFKKIKKSVLGVYTEALVHRHNDYEIHLKSSIDEMASTVSSDLIIISDFNFTLIATTSKIYYNTCYQKYVADIWFLGLH